MALEMSHPKGAGFAILYVAIYKNRYRCYFFGDLLLQITLYSKVVYVKGTDHLKILILSLFTQ